MCSVRELDIRRAARRIRAGGIVAYPTEAVFGLGCLPDDACAVRRILDIKHRSWRKGLLLIGSDLEQLMRFAVLDGSPYLDRILAGWPGPHTWVLPATRAARRWITGGTGTVAVRQTAHPIAAALCRHAGSALVSTSANVSRRPPLRSALRVRRHVGPLVDDVLAGPLGDLEQPTTITDGRTGRVLRGA